MAQLSVEERIKAIQRRLDVSPDGIVGPLTLSRIESVLDRVSGLPAGAEIESNLVASQTGLNEIVRFEISSFSHFERRLARPTWPGGASGVTIGIGYDLGFNTPEQIEKDWRGQVADLELEALLGASGIKGEAARDLTPALGHVVVSVESAKQVFFNSTLPRYADRTRRAYPGVEGLPADAQAMLLSLIYNRGAAMSGSRRREMKAIKPLVASQDLQGIAAQIRSMKRLWDINKLPGLHFRRDREAELVENSDRPYDPSELVRL